MQCLAIDSEGSLLVTGDEKGVICVRLLHQADDSDGHHASFPRDRERATSGSNGDGTTVAFAAAHEGGVLAVSHVHRDARAGVNGGRGITGRGDDENGMLFVSGGAAGEHIRFMLCRIFIEFHESSRVKVCVCVPSSPLFMERSTLWEPYKRGKFPQVPVNESPVRSVTYASHVFMVLQSAASMCSIFISAPLFQLIGAGDVVRLWRATCENVRHSTGSAARLSLNLLTEMHVGGCQVCV